MMPPDAYRDVFNVSVSIINQSCESITLQVTIPFTRSMLNSENIIQHSLNEVGCVATRELLKTFDTEGQNIQFGSVKMTTKGLYNNRSYALTNPSKF